MKTKLFLYLFVVLLCLSFSATQDDISILIGKSLYSKEMKEFINENRRNFESSQHGEGEYYYWDFKSKGIRFSFLRDTIWEIELYGPGYEGIYYEFSDYKSYSGNNIPYRLRITDTRKQVEEILGAPDKMVFNEPEAQPTFLWDTSKVVQYSPASADYYWYKKGISITYETGDTMDMANKIKFIDLTKKQNN